MKILQFCFAPCDKDGTKYMVRVYVSGENGSGWVSWMTDEEKHALRPPQYLVTCMHKLVRTPRL